MSLNNRDISYLLTTTTTDRGLTQLLMTNKLLQLRSEDELMIEMLDFCVSPNDRQFRAIAPRRGVRALVKAKSNG
ncbi:MAG: hypothetical protein ACRC62_05135 [Microcoleus sp.]